MKQKVFVTRRIPQPGLDLLEKEFDVTVNPYNRVLTKEEVIKGGKEADALLCLLTDEIDAEVMDANKNLKIIANYAVGYNNIDVGEATKRKIPVTNTPGVLTDTTADLTWALLLSIARRTPEGDKFTKEGKFKGWDPMLLLGSDVYKKTLGIIGFGRIGYAVAKRAIGFDMKVLYYDVARAKPEIEKEAGGVEFTSIENILRNSDFISVHTVLSKEITHLISEKEFSLMKKTAYLINAARGPIIDEKALVKALKEGKIAGAALDVYEDEPELAPGLSKLDNVVLLPHLGSATIETRAKMATMAASNVVARLKGQTPPNIVNPEVLK